jgi:hypothetical protein
MKVLVIPSIHCNYQKAQKIIDMIDHDKIIFLGNIFDIGDKNNYKKTMNTAIWLKIMLSQSNDTVLWGNHDIQYAYPIVNKKTVNYNEEKYVIINNILDLNDWNKFKKYTIHQNFYLSHAGFTAPLFSKNDLWNGDLNTKQLIDEQFDNLITLGQSQYFDPSELTNGKNKYGGLFWCDIREFKPILGISQIFAHTRTKTPIIMLKDSYYNYSINTGLKHVILIENYKMNIIPID